jgi:hypothetical protein
MGVDLGRHQHIAAGGLGKALLQLCDAVLRKRCGRRDLGTQNVLVVHQALPVHLHEIGEESQARSVGEHQQEFLDRRRELHPRRQVADDLTLGRNRYDGIGQHALQVRVSAHELAERGEVLPRLIGIALLDRDVEEGPGVSGGGGFADSLRNRLRHRQFERRLRNPGT